MTKTVAKNRTAPILAKIASAKCFSLENCFTGQPVKDLGALTAWLNRLGDYKMTFDQATCSGKIREHSNCWYEFTVSA